LTHPLIFISQVVNLPFLLKKQCYSHQYECLIIHLG